ncbi:hypothetical protein ACQP00_43300 [Dactylosporangium sp. CS-047395]|uniref:hypothetical protein n=1 Tax=Dactylosporangium sp. CS-047395 TaxID=3239936 RepID=UPI003D91B4F4
MLYRPKVLRLLPGYRALLRDGKRAKAVVMAEKMWWGTSGAVALNVRLRLKVHFDDGTSTEIDRVERYRDLGGLHTVGSILPVRHDGGRIEVDLPELRRRREADRERHERRSIRAAEAKLRKKSR